MKELGHEVDVPDEEPEQSEEPAEGDSDGGEPETLTRAEAEALASQRAADAEARTRDAEAQRQAEQKAEDERKTRETGQRQAAQRVRNFLFQIHHGQDANGNYVPVSDEAKAQFDALEGSLAAIRMAERLDLRDGTVAALKAPLPKVEQAAFQEDVDKAVRENKGFPAIIEAWTKRIEAQVLEGPAGKKLIAAAVETALVKDKERRMKLGDAGGSAPSSINGRATGRGKTFEQLRAGYGSGTLSAAEEAEYTRLRDERAQRR